MPRFETSSFLSGLLQKASLLAGVNSVIVPIKPIINFSTVILLNEFYKLYLTGRNDGYNMNVEQALREAVRRISSLKIN